MKKLIILCLIVLFCLISIANADLIIRGTDNLGNKLIYDTDQDITWYDYTKRRSNWYNNMAWVDELSISYDGKTFNDWRLPAASSSGEYADEANSEMGHLYYVGLGLLSWYDNDQEHVTDEQLNAFEFDHLVTTWVGGRSQGYWTGTMMQYEPYEAAHTFSFYKTYQGAVRCSYYYGAALAVMDGDIAADNLSASEIPVPASILFLCSGITLLVVVRRVQVINI